MAKIKNSIMKIKSLSIVYFILFSCLVNSCFSQTIERYKAEVFTNFDLLSDIQYGEAINLRDISEKLLLDIYFPSLDTLKKRPLVVFLHGGGFKNGDKAQGYPLLFCQGLVKRGYVVSSINYRLGVAEPQTDTSTFKAMYRAIQDAKAAIRFFRKNANKFGIDTSNVFIMGGSAGSIAALHLAYLDQNEVPDFIDIKKMGTLEGTSGNEGFSSKVKAVINCWGALNNLSWMKKGDIPVFSIHGIKDKMVPYDSSFSSHGSRFGSRIIYERAMSLGIPTGIKLFENTGHTLDSDKEKQRQGLNDACTWLYQFLNKPSLLSNNFPNTFFLDGQLLQKNKIAILANDATKKDALNHLLLTGYKILKAGRLYSVMDKKQIAPSGTKHDYMSTGPYWWPDTSKSNGLPYIRKDGLRNPTYYDITDSHEFDELLNDVESLALSYYFTEDEKYAQFATKLLTTWFLDTATRQNPNLNFAQAIPGINTGRGIGIIETRQLYRAMDGSILLQGSTSWTKQNDNNFQKWCAQYLSWLMESSNGKDELAAHNNHGTHYSVQVIALALFTNRTDIAKNQIDTVKQRMAKQLKPNGSQPFELERTKSWSYSNMNLYGFCINARLAENVGINLWDYETKDGKSIKKCIDWLVPYLKKEQEWTYEQIEKKKYDETIKVLKIATAKYVDAGYEKLSNQVDTKLSHSDFNELVYKN